MDKLTAISVFIDNIGIQRDSILAIYLGAEKSLAITYNEFLRLFVGQTCEIHQSGEWEHFSIKQGDITVATCRPASTTQTTTKVLA